MAQEGLLGVVYRSVSAVPWTILLLCQILEPTPDRRSVKRQDLYGLTASLYRRWGRGSKPAPYGAYQPWDAHRQTVRYPSTALQAWGRRECRLQSSSHVATTG